MTATLGAPTVPEASPDTTRTPPRPVPAALLPWRAPRPWIGWVVALGVALVAGVVRFWSLGFPTGKVFDEVYYATEAQELLRYGYEDNRDYMFIVHPPLGKWLIAGTSALFGNSGFGWRAAGAIAGVLSAVIVARVARRMFRSDVFGGVAGLLMALEGLSVVLSRTAILDIFLQLFVIAGFAALVADRDSMRRRLATMIEAGVDLRERVPTFGPRPWRLVAGVMLGAACAVKWTGAFFFAFFVLLSLFWDLSALRAAGCRRRGRAWGRRSVLPALGSLLAVPVGTYLLTYLGWFTGENSWGRHWADTHSPSTHITLLGLRVPFTWAWVPAPIRSLGAYTLDAYRFHEGLDSPHPYQSNPWSWWVLGRPVDFYYKGTDKTCGSTACAREILLIGTPVLWWAFIPMILWLAWHWITTRDWRAGAIWVAVVAGWLVWFQDLKRTMFLFYMAPLVPFLVLGLTLALGTMVGPALRRTGDAVRDGRSLVRRYWGIAAVSVFLGLVVTDFVWMWPIFTGGLRSYNDWHAHMWLPSWV